MEVSGTSGKVMAALEVSEKAILEKATKKEKAKMEEKAAEKRCITKIRKNLLGRST